MFLKSLEVQGFKSFPDKTKLDFGRGLTAVVGPNGSGKSNISDAMRWVLGEQSTKTLRGSKMEDVIFNGTVKRSPLGFAQVSITIDNSDHAMDIDDEEVTITRKLFRSGESEYRINKNNVRLKDIHELFMDTGMGRDGYSIIGQGKIADIVSAKSAERREIFEEASGISKYRYRKNESERRLEQTQENLLRLKDIMVELEDRVGPLKVQSEKAAKFIKLAEEKKQLEVSLFIKNIDKSKETLREQENRIMVCRAEYDGVDEELNKLEADINAIFTKAQECSVRIEEKRSEKQKAEEELAKSEAVVAVLKNDIFHKNENIERIKREISAEDEAQGGIAAQMDEQLAGAKEKREYIETVKNNLANSEKALEDFLKDNAAHDEHIEEYGTKLTGMNNEISSLRQRAMVCASGISELAARSETVKQNLAVKKQNGEQNKRELNEATAFIAELDQKIESEANTVKGYEFKLNKRKEKLSVSDKELADIELKIKEKEQNAKLLEDLEKNMEGFAGSVKSVMRLASNGTLRGIHGTVASLISVPKEYTVAVETALSYALQNIVTENEDSAKRAINILKSQNAGRATFLPLSTIKGSAVDTKGIADCPGFVGVASSLVGYDKKYTGIVENLLGRIVVCEDLDDAVNMARKNSYRFRIVTLDGQVINAGGSLTGGSTVKSSGILSRRTDIEALRRKAQELSVKAEQLRSENADLKAEIASLEADYLACTSELTTMKEDRADADTRARILATTMEETEKTIAEFNDELEKACIRIAELKGEQNKSDEERAALEAKAQELEKQLDSTMQSKDELRTRRHKLTEEISALKMEIFGAEKEAESLENAAEELRRRRENQSGRFAELKAESEKLENEIGDINKQIEDILASKDEVRRSVAGFDSEMAGITAEKLELEKQATTRRGEEREILSRREDVSKEMARLEERKIAVQTEYDSIIAKLWDEYELTKSEATEIAGEIESITAAQRSLAEIKSKIRALGSVNVEAIEEYKEVKERYEFLSEQIADVEKSRDELLKIIGDLTSRMREIFAESFTQINKNFGEVFVELFGGGRASLKLTDEGDVLESGIDILVEPPGKVIKNLSALSGGEQAFIAIAIYFAILKVRPAPFCLLDEIEAALDDVNVTKYAQYLHRLNDRTQFIAITHRRGTMEEADALYGVTMQENGVSKLLELKVNEVASRLGI